MSEWKPKISTCMKGYDGKQFRKGVAAGIPVAITAFPLSVALTVASGLGPERGLYTTIAGDFLVSAPDDGRVNIGGITVATVMTVFFIIGESRLSDLAMMMIMAGLILIAMGILRASALLKYISKTTTLGFMAGIAAGIFSGQLKGFFGLEMGAIPVKILDKFIVYGKVIHTVDVATLLVGLTAMGILIALPKVTTEISASLAAILMTTPVAVILSGKVDTIRSVYGELPSHFPAFTMPEISLEMIENLILSALTLVLLTAIVSLLVYVVADGLMGERHGSNQELMAEGVANVFYGFFGAAPVAGAVARASDNVKDGRQTPVAGMVHNLIVLLVLLFFIPLTGYIPIPTLSAILIMVTHSMSNWQGPVLMAKHAPESNFTVLTGTFLVDVFVDPLFAVKVEVIILAVFFMGRMSDVASVRSWEYLPQREDGDPERLSLRVVPRHTLVYEIEGLVFLTTVDLLMNVMATPDTKVIVPCIKSVPSMGIAALRSIEGLLERCHKEGMILVLFHAMERPYTVMEKASFLGRLGKENLCANIDEVPARVGVTGRM